MGICADSATNDAPRTYRSAAVRRCFRAGRIGADSSAYRAAPRLADFADSDGLDLSARSGSSGAVCQAKFQSQGRCIDRRSRETELGPECQIARELSSGAYDDERKARLDAEVGRCVSGGPKNRFGYDPEPAGQGASVGQSPDN